MPKRRSLIVACAAGAALAVGMPSAAGRAAAPPGYQHVVDDTGTIAVSVPASWAVGNTAPIEGVYGDRSPRPFIGAGNPVEFGTGRSNRNRPGRTAPDSGAVGCDRLSHTVPVPSVRF